jgi:hypothetical protein
VWELKHFIVMLHIELEVEIFGSHSSSILFIAASKTKAILTLIPFIPSPFL